MLHPSQDAKLTQSWHEWAILKPTYHVQLHTRRRITNTVPCCTLVSALVVLSHISDDQMTLLADGELAALRDLDAIFTPGDDGGRVAGGWAG